MSSFKEVVNYIVTHPFNVKLSIINNVYLYLLLWRTVYNILLIENYKFKTIHVVWYQKKSHASLVAQW